MKSIRDHVVENVLAHGSIEIADYERALFHDGKGWVGVHGDAVVGFACGRIPQGDVWALFVDRAHEGRGVGRRLLELVEVWMFSAGCRQIVLTTEAGTRAERLYRRLGWEARRVLPDQQIEFVLAPRGPTP